MNLTNLLTFIKTRFARNKHKPLKGDNSFKPGTKLKIKKRDSLHNETEKRKNNHHLFSFRNRLFKIFVILIGILLALAIVYFSAQAVLKIRDTSTDEQKVIYINGLDKVPVFPNSESVFANSENTNLVQQFYNKGYIVYRLPVDSNIEDAYEFYKAELPKSGWSFEDFVTVADNKRKFGQYWTKGALGLRIYSDINDIWYQKLSDKEAKTFLSEQVAKEQEIKDILAQKELVTLLPNYAWSMNVPSEYIVSYVSSDIGEFQTAVFTKTEGNEVIRLEPIAFNSGEYLITQITNYCKTKNCKLNSNNEISTRLGTILNITFTDLKDNKTYYGYVVINSETHIIYLLYGISKESALYQYMIDNLVPVVQTKLS